MQTIDFIFKVDQCEEIRIALFHQEGEDGKLAVNKDVENIFKAKGFRWKSVNNDSNNNRRSTIYALKRQEEQVAVVERGRQEDHIVLESISYLVVGDNLNEKNDQRYLFDMNVNILGSLDEFYKENKEEYSHLDKMKSQLTILKDSNYSF